MVQPLPGSLLIALKEFYRGIEYFGKPVEAIALLGGEASTLAPLDRGWRKIEDRIKLFLRDLQIFQEVNREFIIKSLVATRRLEKWLP